MSKFEASSYCENRPPAEYFNDDLMWIIHTMQTYIEVPGEPTIHLRHVDYADYFALTQVVERNRKDLARYLNWTADANIQTMLTRIKNALPV